MQGARPRGGPSKTCCEMAAGRLVVVSGANRGVGLGIVHQLLQLETAEVVPVQPEARQDHAAEEEEEGAGMLENRTRNVGSGFGLPQSDPPSTRSKPPGGLHGEFCWFVLVPYRGTQRVHIPRTYEYIPL